MAEADGVFHCAGKVSRKPEDADALYQVHVGGTRAVIDAARAAHVKRVVIASTSGTVAVSEDATHVATESDEAPVLLLSRWPYYRTKLYAEELALAESGDGLEVVSINPTLLLGPGDTRGSSTEDVRLFLDRRIPAVPKGGLSYVDVRDAAAGMILAMTRGTPGRRYLLGACNLTVSEFFARLARISGVPAPWLPMPRMPGLARAGADLLGRLGRGWLSAEVDPVSFEMAQFYWYLDSSLAERDLGWAPRDPMETLADTIRDLGERKTAWKGLYQPYDSARDTGHSDPAR
jgi:dihydroflavonol-4-reductase